MTVFIEAHYVGNDTQPIGLAVLCSCGALLADIEDPISPQLLLDEAVDAAWYHRDCGECEEH